MSHRRAKLHEIGEFNEEGLAAIQENFQALFHDNENAPEFLVDDIQHLVGHDDDGVLQVSSGALVVGDLDDYAILAEDETITGDWTFQGSVLFSKQVRFNGVADVTFAATPQNNLDIGDITVINVVRSDGIATVVTGIEAGSAGQILLWHNIDAADSVTFNHENTNSTAANRILTPNDVDFILNDGEGCLFWYDGSASRWRILAAPQ